MRLKPELNNYLLFPLAEANGNEEKKKTEMNLAMKNNYCRRFLTDGPENQITDRL